MASGVPSAQCVAKTSGNGKVSIEAERTVMSANASLHEEKQDIEEIFFRDIQGKYVPVKNSANDGSRGDALEKCYGKEVDNKSMPDLGLWELKTRLKKTSSLVTLFNKAPTKNNELRKLYGWDDVKNGIPFKRLNATLTVGSFIKSDAMEHRITLEVNEEEDELRIVVQDLEGRVISDDDHVWNLTDLKNKVEQKIKNLIIVDCSQSEDKSGVLFNDMHFCTITGERFIRGLIDGDVKVDIRMGIYGSGKNAGKLHDHGTGFRASMNWLSEQSYIEEGVC